LGETHWPRTRTDGCSLSEGIVIEAPVEAVWSYISDSDNAREWSVYFHHISPLSGIADGEMGSVRRCFRNATETDGVWWDEVVLEVQPHRYRRILAYNAHGFQAAHLNAGEFYVHQHVERLDSARTRLTFAAEQLRPAGMVNRLRFLHPARVGRVTFRHNLEDIASAVEAKHRQAPYRRLHPYVPPGQHILD
jgi:uncharacterized protein YndB with AHSA1/START domain